VPAGMGGDSKRSTSQNTDGRGNMLYLDRHNVKCNKDQAMTRWKIGRPSGRTIRVKFTCQTVRSGLESCERKSTSPSNDGGWNNRNTMYLDRHTLNCGDDKMLTKWKLNRVGGKVQFKYTCCAAKYPHKFGQGNEPLNALDYVKAYQVQNGKGMDCKLINWAESLKQNKQAECPTGYWLNGIKRKGSKSDGGTGIDQITAARCCRDKGMTKEWGTCEDVEIFGKSGWSACKTIEQGSPSKEYAAAMVGIKADGLEGLDSISHAKCCALKVKDPTGNQMDGSGTDIYGNFALEGADSTQNATKAPTLNKKVMLKKVFL